MLTLQLELMESRWNDNNGEASRQSLETYQRVVGSLRRTLETLGLERRTRDVTPAAADVGQLINGVVKQSRAPRRAL